MIFFIALAYSFKSEKYSIVTYSNPIIIICILFQGMSSSSSSSETNDPASAGPGSPDLAASPGSPIQQASSDSLDLPASPDLPATPVQPVSLVSSASSSPSRVHTPMSCSTPPSAQSNGEISDDENSQLTSNGHDINEQPGYSSNKDQNDNAAGDKEEGELEDGELESEDEQEQQEEVQFNVPPPKMNFTPLNIPPNNIFTPVEHLEREIQELNNMGNVQTTFHYGHHIQKVRV